VRARGRQFPRAHSRSFMRDPGIFIRRQRGRPTTANQVATTLRILRGGGGWTGMLDGTGMPHEQTYESTNPEYHVRMAHPPGRGSASPGCDERPIPLPRASLSFSHFSEAARGTRLQSTNCTPSAPMAHRVYALLVIKGLLQHKWYSNNPTPKGGCNKRVVRRLHCVA
jgi:hypothetical protein